MENGSFEGKEKNENRFIAQNFFCFLTLDWLRQVTNEVQVLVTHRIERV